MSASRTGLGGFDLSGRHLHQHSPCLSQLVGNRRAKHLPTHIQNGAVEPCLLSLAGTPLFGFASHLLGFQLLGCNQAITAYNLCCLLVYPILPLVSYFAVEFGHPLLSFLPTTRILLFASQLTLYSADIGLGSKAGILNFATLLLPSLRAMAVKQPKSMPTAPVPVVLTTSHSTVIEAYHLPAQ